MIPALSYPALGVHVFISSCGSPRDDREGAVFREAQAASTVQYLPEGMYVMMLRSGFVERSCILDPPRVHANRISGQLEQLQYKEIQGCGVMDLSRRTIEFVMIGRVRGVSVSVLMI